MQLTTTRLNSGAKPFSWSYSKLKNFESCPKRHYHVDVLKDIKEDQSDALVWGNIVHKALEQRIIKSTPLPVGMEPYEQWCLKVIGDGTGEIFGEQKLAITKDFAPCTYFDRAAWYRSVADILKIDGSVGLAVDWKTGKILEDGSQLALMAACAFAHYPDLMVIRTEFIWLKEDASTRADFRREQLAEIWKSIWPRIEALEHAYKTTSFPAKPNYLCKRWCPVSSCIHHGE